MNQYLKKAQEVLNLEAQALQYASVQLTEEKLNKLISVYSYLNNIGASLVISGVGKSGIIAQKIASTFNSVGLPSFYLHPVEALHGDLGRVRKGDVMMIISKSGTTEELIKLLNVMDISKDSLIALIGEVNSPLAARCSLVFDCHVEREACINDQAPTTSSTLAMAMGDAMAVVYEMHIGLSKEKFAQNHPGGILGKSLRLKVKNLMWPLADCPTVSTGTLLKEVIFQMTKRPAGGLAVINFEGEMLGIIVEGDIRRAFSSGKDGMNSKVEEIMNANPISIDQENLAYEALELMEGGERAVSILPVLNGKMFVGFLRLHDLLREGFVRKK